MKMCPFISTIGYKIMNELLQLFHMNKYILG